jgi:hypothetical protein
VLELFGDGCAVELFEHGARRLAGPESLDPNLLGEIAIRAVERLADA